MVALIGFADLSTRDAFIFGFLALLAGIVMAWVIDLVSGEIGYGVFGNWIITMLAIYGGLALYHRYLGQVLLAEPVRVIGVVLATIMSTFFLLIVVRRLLR